jgi:hypothetical protein
MRPVGRLLSLPLWVALGSMSLASACCVNPFHHTRPPDDHGRPGNPEEEARRSIQPEQAAVQPSASGNSPGAGFDIRLVRVQPGIHIRTEQPCDVVFTGRAEGVVGRDAERYQADVGQRMAIKCHAPTGEGWADMVFARAQSAQVAEVRRGRRVRVRILAADGGYFDYPVVQFMAVEGEHEELARLATRPQQVAVPNGFSLAALREDPTLVGSLQQCAVAFADEIVLVDANDRRRRSYPAGVQNRMTVRCKHASGEEAGDLVFMPSQALAALGVRRGEVIPVRIVSRNGGAVDHPVLQYAGP